MARIFPSLMAADLMNMQKEIEHLDPHCDGYHLDIMDDHFVPNITFGIDFIDSVNKITARPLWVQLLLDNVEKWVDKIELNANSILTFHIESTKDIRNLADRIKKKNIVPSISINPNTPVERVFPFLDVVHHVVVMSVIPGFSGAPFLPESIEKVDALVSYCQNAGIQCTVAMDGGIGDENIGKLVYRGAEDFVVGSAIFSSKDRVDTIKKLYELCKKEEKSIREVCGRM